MSESIALRLLNELLLNLDSGISYEHCPPPIQHRCCCCVDTVVKWFAELPSIFNLGGDTCVILRKPSDNFSRLSVADATIPDLDLTATTP